VSNVSGFQEADKLGFVSRGTEGEGEEVRREDNGHGVRESMELPSSASTIRVSISTWGLSFRCQSWGRGETGGVIQRL
jgi:hypothetical protein